MLRAPNSGKVMIPVGAGSGIVSAVCRTASIIMHRCLVVPIHHVEGAIRSHSRMDWTEPNIGTGQEFCIFAACFFAGQVCCAVRSKDVIVDEAYGRFLEEKIVVPAFGPRSAVIEATACGGCKHSYPINLHIRLACWVDQRSDFLMIRHHCRCADACNTASGQNFLG